MGTNQFITQIENSTFPPETYIVRYALGDGNAGVSSLIEFSTNKTKV